MAVDHFENRKLALGQIDWNFNLTFTGEQDVARMVREYAPLLTHPGLYPPVPVEWLHTTLLRIGTTEEFTEAEMLAVAEGVQKRVSELRFPEFRFDSWWLLFGNVVFHISPDDEFTKLYDVVTASLIEIVGKERAAKTQHGRYLSHATFAYAKAHSNEQEMHARLTGSRIEPAVFRARNMPLIRQWPKDGHYEWEVVKQITLG